MKKLFGLVLAVFLFGNVWAQSNDESGKITSISDIEVLSDDVEFNGILPSARKKKCAEWSQGLCSRWENDAAYERSVAGQLGKKIEEGTIEFTDLPIFIVKAIDFLTKLVGTVALLFMIYGGFQLMTDQKDDGKNTIKYAIAGVFVAFLSWLVVNIVKTQFTGVDYYGNSVVTEETQKKETK